MLSTPSFQLSDRRNTVILGCKEDILFNVNLQEVKWYYKQRSLLETTVLSRVCFEFFIISDLHT